MESQKLIPATQTGGSVQCSSVFGHGCFNYQLNFSSQRGDQQFYLSGSWCAKDNNSNQWIQVGFQNPTKWLAIDIQGRSDYDQWVTEFMVTFSNDGTNFYAADNGKIFKANDDRNTIKRITFQNPQQTRIVRIQPTSWNNHISLRFEAYYQD